MATWDDVRRIALALPETDEATSYGNRAWRVREKGFVWERPLGKKDITELTRAGAELPDGPVLAARVADLGVKQALLADDPRAFFDTPHFTGYPAILIHLDRIAPDVLTEITTEAWLAKAPKRLAGQYLRSVEPGR